MDTTLLAQDGFDTAITSAISGMSADFTTVGVAGIAIGVVLFGLQRGWSFLRSLV